jgi:hypothetical protein
VHFLCRQDAETKEEIVFSSRKYFLFRKQSAAEQNRKKVRSKSLKTINIEERAIEELKAMYAQKFPYDIITVKRAHLDVSAPVWTKS